MGLGFKGFKASGVRVLKLRLRRLRVHGFGAWAVLNKGAHSTLNRHLFFRFLAVFKTGGGGGPNVAPKMS